jgi:hypothetical protein
MRNLAQDGNALEYMWDFGGLNRIVICVTARFQGSPLLL